MRLWAILTSAALFLAGSVAAPLRGASGAEGDPTAVVALIDTGINPYHVVFRDDSMRARRHPSTYIPGFPKDARALHISLHEKDYETAVRKDCKLWQSVERGKLYWFPGTKIVGGITFESGDIICESAMNSNGHIIDGFGHGTMVASRAAANGYGACPECRIVAVQGLTDGVEWAANNSEWIDAQSNSWGPILPLWAPADDGLILFNHPQFVRTVEAAARKHLSFWASGNGVATRGGVLGHPTIVDPRMTPSIVMVGGHDSGYINTWPDFPPHVVADSCDSWAAPRHRINGSREDLGSGTSAASPWAAGAAARMLLEARRLLGDSNTGITKGVAARGNAEIAGGPLADGRFTLEEWKEVLFKTATSRPRGQKHDGRVCGLVEGLLLFSSTPVRWEQIPEGYPEFLHIGYGATDDVSMDLASDVLSGKANLPDRSRTDAYFEIDESVRTALHGVFRGL